MRYSLFVKVILLPLAALCLTAAPDEFSTKIRPILTANCANCHNPANPRNRIDFLKTDAVTDVDTRRALWRDVATQLRNRTMPPGEAKISEADRLLVSNWIEERLRTTGCTTGDYAGYVAPRRLNRREWKNTIRDLFGLDVIAPDLFPADEAGGAGFRADEIVALFGGWSAGGYGTLYNYHFMIDELLWPRTAAGGWDPDGYSWAMAMTAALQAIAALVMATAARRRRRV